jgi:ribosomal protein S21
VRPHEFEKTLKLLKKQFKNQILPELKRKQYALGKSEAKRLKHNRAIKRQKRRLARQRR